MIEYTNESDSINNVLYIMYCVLSVHYMGYYTCTLCVCTCIIVCTVTEPLVNVCR